MIHQLILLKLVYLDIAHCVWQRDQEYGILHTIDINEVPSIARRYFDSSIYSRNIKQYIGNAINILPTLKYNYQLAFIDADKENTTILI